MSWESRFGASWHDTLGEVVLAIGTDVFTRRDIAVKLGCVNVKAARILHKVLRKFKPKSVAELTQRLTVEELFATNGVGITVLYVWLNVLSYKGIGAEAWLNNELSISTMYRACKPLKKKKWLPRR